MKYLLLTPALVLLSLFPLLAQTDNTARVVWERYHIAGHKVSFLFPKLPTVWESRNPCTQEHVVIHRAYAEGAAYEVMVFASGQAPRPQGCAAPVNRFDGTAVEERLRNIEREGKFKGWAATKVAGREGFRFTTADRTRILVPDVDPNRRWIELNIVHYADKIPDRERFFSSLKLDNTDGKDVGSGSELTLGDAGVKVTQPEISAKGEAGDKPKSKDTGQAVLPLTFVANEAPRYTDAARQAGIEGSVRLKLTLLGNGAVGKIVPLKELPFGLTEQAIRAAKRIVFLPKRVNGEPVTGIMTIEFGFMKDQN